MDTPRFSPTSAADAQYARLAAAAVAHLLALQPAPCALVLQGSAATGEAWALREDSGALRLLSDLDLGVIVESDDDREAWRAHAADFPRAMSAAMESMMAAERPAARGAMPPAAPWSLGVYSRDDLPRQAPKMGTLELAWAGRVLSGDPMILATVAPRDPRVITAAESLRLLGVRAHEWGQVEDAGATIEQVMTAAVKLVADAGTAVLASHGAYCVGGAARRDALAELWQGEAHALAEAVPWLPARIRAAQDVRLREARWPEVAAALGADAARRLTPGEIRRMVRPVLLATGTWLARAAAAEWSAAPTYERQAAETVGAADSVRAALVDPTAFATTLRAWLTAAPRGTAWRQWLRAGRRTAPAGTAPRLLGLAFAHRLGPPPWAVAVALALEAATVDEVPARVHAREVWQWVEES